MRRTLQRCALSVPRSLSFLNNPGRNAVTRSSTSQRLPTHIAPRRNGLRCIHSTSRVQEQAGAQTSADEEAGVDGNGDQIITKFHELGTRNLVHQTIVDTLTGQMGMETMTEVQTRTINQALKGTDVIAQARTGTGKTLAFLLPVLQRIIDVDPNLARRAYSRRGARTTADDIRALIISPTRELAEQIAEEAKKITRDTSLIVQTAVGGTQKRAGLAAIQRQGCHILVGTPGRLKDILSDPYTRVEAPELDALVFDEADRLLDQGFWPEIQEIMRLLPTPVERDRQTMMFSATIPQEVVSLVRSTLKPGFQFVKCVNDNEEPTHARVPQKLVRLNGFENGLPSLIELLSRGVAAAQQPGERPFKAIVYYNSTAEVTLASSALRGLEAPPAPDEPGEDAFGYRRRPNALAPARILEIHSKLSQGQRTAAADAFRRAESGILISSDVTARGMDFPNVTHVIQMGLPTSREQYIHRIGRTARAGKEGEGWLFLNGLEAAEASSRLRGLPLNKDDTLTIPSLDLTRAADVPTNAGKVLSMYQSAMKKVSALEKSKTYLALLGVYNYLGRKAQLVQQMNSLSRYGWGLAQPPFIPPGLAQKLGLSRLEGIRIGTPEEDPRNGGSFGGREDRFGGRGSSGRGGFGGRDSFGGRGGRDSSGGRSGRDGRSGRGGRDSFGGRDEFGDSSRDRSGERFGERFGGPRRPRDHADSPF